MQDIKKTLFALTILTIVTLSFVTMFSLVQSSTNSFPQNEQLNLNSSPFTSNGDVSFSGFSDYAYDFNATAVVNRTVSIEHYGVVSIADSIEVTVIGNESITYFNYTLPNINTGNLRYISFRASNNTKEGLVEANATRIYTYNRLLNYTTFVISFNRTLASIGQGDVYFIGVYSEYSMPFDVSLEDREQVLHYQELLYPLINNIPIINSTTEVIKQGNDNFLDDANHPVTPSNDTAEGIIVVVQAEQGSLKWSNISREVFNYTQSYADDLMMNIYTQSVSTAEAVEEAVNTILFKATKIYRRLEVDPFGTIKVTETQELLFLGPEAPPDHILASFKLYALNAFTVVFPPNTTVLDLYDEIGGLNLDYQLDKQNVFESGTFNLRESIFPNHPGLVIFPRAPLFKGDTMTYTIVYKIPTEVFLSKEQGSISYELNLEPCSVINWTVDELILDVVLPKGTVYVSSDYKNPDPYQQLAMSYRKEFDIFGLGFKRIFQFSTNDFSGSDNAPLIVRFKYSRFNLWLTYFLQAIGIGLIFVIYLGIRWSTKAVKDVAGIEAEKEFIPVDEIEDFVKQYEEILSIRERLRETRAKVAAKKLKAKAGKDLITKLEKRLRAEEENLKLTKENLIKQGGRYKESVQKIEIAERRLYEERRNLRALQQEYRVKKSMTKDSYIKLFRERQQSIEKLKNEIDGILVTLRMLLEP